MMCIISFAKLTLCFFFELISDEFVFHYELACYGLIRIAKMLSCIVSKLLLVRYMATFYF